MAMRSKVAVEFADFFLVRTASLFTLRTFGAQINWRVISRKVLFDPHRFLSNKSPIILLERAEKEIRFSMANGTLKMKMDIDRHCPRLMPNNCQNLYPPYFSLPSTFKLDFLPKVVTILFKTTSTGDAISEYVS